jgi:arabinan endo-1,5-alpha-L-arabinosidase
MDSRSAAKRRGQPLESAWHIPRCGEPSTGVTSRLFQLARRVVALGCAASVGCSSSSPSSGAADTGVSRDASGDARPRPDSGGLPSHDAEAGRDSSSPPIACSTRIAYGAAWIHPADHPDSFDDVAGEVTWDGTCTDDGDNSYALLSNGFKPYFQGKSACILALDERGACGDSATAACATEINYGAAWLAPASHPARYDRVEGRVFSDGLCTSSGGASYANLSNGWQPHFSGPDACALSFEYTQCGGLYANPVIPTDCPDPGVLLDGSEYVLTCTSGDAPDAYPIFTSTDLVHWTARGSIFPSGHWPSWAMSDFWAPEIHRVGSGYVAYFSARDNDGMLSIGAASASTATGPFTDIGKPLVHDSTMGHIDASEFNDTDGTPYALWKDDGNAVGKPTPIHIQALTSKGLALTGSPATLITNDRAWEGPVTEAPFMVAHGGSYFLFYSGNVYSTANYAIGVAQASSPIGPFTKATNPILVTGGAWGGPGHCAVVDTPLGDTYVVYAAWEASSIGGGPGRLVLTDAVTWGGGWPSVPLAPSSTTRPLP